MCLCFVVLSFQNMVPPSPLRVVEIHHRCEFFFSQLFGPRWLVGWGDVWGRNDLRVRGPLLVAPLLLGITVTVCDPLLGPQGL